ncbi:MAG: acylneuraminate cytidylyltransferase [Candidatus Niyogibacteria bacterium CG10_big_fil_rev_8_21_14_0_10_42_19]|uniref:Acylneuraminate cytidylyltransferase n=1 Tax=Candidatus Niyogibacteria bacterium CG10_big_fil_rev_8_21_14_0_10_42_19 TaxID=1974725 RepID=A0A2H0TFT0_9BACT|nr:MAG: acylneuraminate cytidylyltransferase [Candidatus Niyogibacteria bacterium CG10_big_fil_rev_8_21_14_0_10_42_19]
METSKIKVLGIVGARSGSKGIHDKNIRPLLGKPLMAWVIEAAKKSKYISRLIISTDSKEYTDIAKKHGAEAPFLRPEEISGDEASDIDYLTHAVSWLEQNEGWKPDIILRLPPTSPLCKTESIDACVELLLNDPDATSSRTIIEAPKHPYKLWKIEDDHLLPFIPKEQTGFDEPSNMARQLFPPAYAHVDVIAVRYDTLMKDLLLTGKKVRYHKIPKTDAVDIDNEIDFMLAEFLLKRRLNGSIT